MAGKPRLHCRRSTHCRRSSCSQQGSQRSALKNISHAPGADRAHRSPISVHSPPPLVASPPWYDCCDGGKPPPRCKLSGLDPNPTWSCPRSNSRTPMLHMQPPAHPNEGHLVPSSPTRCKEFAAYFFWPTTGMPPEAPLSTRTRAAVTQGTAAPCKADAWSYITMASNVICLNKQPHFPLTETCAANTRGLPRVKLSLLVGSSNHVGNRGLGLALLTHRALEELELVLSHGRCALRDGQQRSRALSQSCSNAVIARCLVSSPAV